MKLTVAYSPCPNDTFMFHDLASGKLTMPDRRIEVQLHDVETLNRMALAGTFDVTKVSFHTYLLVRKQYQLLSVGAALGFGCGPLVVSNGSIAASEIAGARVAVPGKLTTAHLLLELWEPRITNKVFVRYNKVMDMVAGGEVDAGVIIHEGRFVYEQAGLELLSDLGLWWQEQTQLPIPLGGIVARKSLGKETISRFESVLREAIGNSMADPAGTREYVLQHAAEMDSNVLDEHIKAFVNDYSLDLGDEGRSAVAEMRQRAQAAGIIK
ncbi:MAG: 1,4-dihydroxy-6-naphthoate synthase [Phycisphaerae bacterium]|nr:1,4-dihydroxy-6-naphthoate synthase [Phycisphaerae bacterium]